MSGLFRGSIAAILPTLVVLAVLYSSQTGGDLPERLGDIADSVIPDDLKVTVDNTAGEDLVLIGGEMWRDVLGDPLLTRTIDTDGRASFSMEANRLTWCLPRTWGVWAVRPDPALVRLGHAGDADLPKLVAKLDGAVEGDFEIVDRLRIGKCYANPRGSWQIAPPR